MQDKHTPGERSGGGQTKSKPAMGSDAKPVSTSVLTWMAILSCAIFGMGLFIAVVFGGL